MDLAIHVDDGIIFGKNIAQMQELLKQLKSEFEITVNENPKVYLGLEIDISDSGITLSQASYTKRLLKKFRMSECRPVSTPLEKQGEEELKPDQSNYPYRQIVGHLQYLSCKTRPDITYAVNYVNRFVEKPTTQDVNNVKRILRYLKGTQNVGIKFTSGKSMTAYCDSDYAGSGDRGKMKSTSGYVVTYMGGPVYWCSRKQDITATSSSEAEYISAAECCKEIQYLSSLNEELTGKAPEVEMLIDNTSAINLIKTGQMNRRSKHIKVRYYYISEEYDNKLFSIVHCPTGDQLADIFTKPLQAVKFEKFKNALTNKLI